MPGGSRKNPLAYPGTIADEKFISIKTHYVRAMFFIFSNFPPARSGHCDDQMP